MLARLSALLLLLPLAPAHAAPGRTPHQVIATLDVTLRQATENPRPGASPGHAVLAAVEELNTIMGIPEQRPLLVEVDSQGRTPLMQAVSAGYLLVVKALLADPGVRSGINHADANGETAWMVANFAPSMTLMACQPGALTLERYPLLRPYLDRMTALLAARQSAVSSIVQALEDAGAQPTPDAAKRAWLARCPNAPPELRQTIDRDPLLPTLINESLARQMAFNKALRAGDLDIPQKPPEGMRFNAARDPPGASTPVLTMARMRCARMTPPAIRGALDWSGSLLLRARVSTRAGVVETADFSVMSPAPQPPHVVDFFRGAVIRALATYQCEGDHVFEQDFNFKTE